MKSKEVFNPIIAGVGPVLALFFALSQLLPAQPTGSVAWPRHVTAAPNSLMLVPPESEPMRGTFYRIQRSDLPPVPFNQCPGLPVYALGDNRFLIDDSSVDYSAVQEAAEIERVLQTAEVALGLRTAEVVDPVAHGASQAVFGPDWDNSEFFGYTTNDLWLEITNVLPTTTGLIIHSPTPGEVYDLYCTTNLTPIAPWYWVLRTLPGQTNLSLANTPRPDAFYILGRTNDTDHGGLPDAWEQLVTHGNINNPSDDALPVVSLIVVDSVAVEQAGVSNPASFLISRPASAAAGAVTVGISTSGSAQYGVDYALSPVFTNNAQQLCVTLGAGVTNLTVWLVALPDSTQEGTETATLSLVDNMPGYVVDPSHHIATAWILEEYTKTYTTTADFNLGTMAGLEAVNDQLQFRTNLPAQFPFINVACSDNGTVARINTTNGQVIGEYQTAPDGLSFSGEDGLGSQPSRTTVDQYGNVWVANRDDTRDINGVSYGSITRIGLIIGGTRFAKTSSGNYITNATGEYVSISDATYNTCIDRDGDGYIRTSHGLGNVLTWVNPDGVDSDGGVSSAEDEAITEYTRVLCTGTRTIAVDKFNDIWVGGHPKGFVTNRIHLKVNGLTGAMVPDSAFDIRDGGYGGVIDGSGNLWSSGGSDGTGLRLNPPLLFPPQQNWDLLSLSAYAGGYGIAADPVNPYVWQTHGPNVFRWHLDGSLVTNSDGNVELHPHGGGDTSLGRGLAVDLRGHVWVAHGGDQTAGENGLTTVGHLDTNGVLLGNVKLDFGSRDEPWIGITPMGISVDSSNKIWVVNWWTSDAMRIDPDAGPTTNTQGQSFHIGAVDMAVRLLTNTHPYNYSDMTGFNNRIVNPGGQPLKGYWSVINDCGLANEYWERVSWTAGLTNGGTVEVWVRASDDRAALASGTFVSVSNNVQFTGVNGRYIEVRAALKRDNTNQWPVLYDLTLYGLSTSFDGGFVDDAYAQETQNGEFFAYVTAPGPLTYEWWIQYPWMSEWEWILQTGQTNAGLVISNVDSWVGARLDAYGNIRETLTLARVHSVTGESLWLNRAGLLVSPLSMRLPSASYASGPGPAQRYPATINVFGQPTNILEARVFIWGLSHQRSADLNLLLVSPSGVSVMLMSHVGGTNGVSHADLEFRQNWSLPPASLPIPSETRSVYSPSNFGNIANMSVVGDDPPPSGPYSVNFGSLVGTNPNGIWKLYIYDVQQGAVGSLSGSWQLDLTFQ